jgi:5-methyltetrahydrofolate--homocysteine methyltransferase
LALHNAENQVHELNIAGVEIARKAADHCERTIIIAGSIGPTGEIIEPLGNMTKAEATCAFTDQAIALKEGGADVAWVESMYSEEEMECAIIASKQAGLPIILTNTFDSHGKSMMGLEPKELVTLAEQFSPEMIGYGANCGIGASELIGSILCLAKSRQNHKMHLVAKGNCGIPEYSNGEIVYNGTEEIMATYACYARKLGATIIGGCCGTKAEHVKAMADALTENTMECPLELDQMIKSMGEMTKGNIAMVQRYLNSEDSPKVDAINPRRQRRRRKKLN